MHLQYSKVLVTANGPVELGSGLCAEHLSSFTLTLQTFMNFTLRTTGLGFLVPV